MTRNEIYDIVIKMGAAAEEFVEHIRTLEMAGRMPMRPIEMQKEDVAKIKEAAEILMAFADRRMRGN